MHAYMTMFIILVTMATTVVQPHSLFSIVIIIYLFVEIKN